MAFFSSDNGFLERVSFRSVIHCRPISIVFYIPETDVPTLNSLRANSSIRSNIHIEVVIQSNSSYYPVNKLRNIAISHVNTSHFYISDMDIWPARKVIMKNTY